MRFACVTALLVLLAIAEARAQQAEPDQPALTVRSNLVLVPALVKTRQGTVFFGLTAGDLYLTDNGIPQKLTLDPDTDSEPLALAICVETGGAGASHIEEYGHLDAFLDALIGGVEHRVAVIGFDGAAHLLLPFHARNR